MIIPTVESELINFKRNENLRIQDKEKFVNTRKVCFF